MTSQAAKVPAKLRLLGAGAALALCAGTANAQDTPAAVGASNPPQSTPTQTVRTQANGVAEVVVTAHNYVPRGSQTASKSDIPLIETPQSISVITRDQIDLLNFVDAQQAVRYTAGVSGENYGPDLRYDFITVRGFTPRQFIDGLAAPATTTISSTGVDLYAFESLEILKGPSSILYGLAPPGGIYNELSRRASSTFGGELQAKYGSYDYKSVEGTLTGAISDRVSARMTALYLDRDAERRKVSADRLLLAPTATWKTTDRTTLTGLFYYQHDRVDGDTNGFLPVVGTLLPNPLGQIDHRANFGEPDYNFYERDQYGLGAELNHRFNNVLQFHSSTKYSNYRENSRSIYGGGGLRVDNRTLDRYNFPYREKVESLATDNRLDARFATGALTHKLVFGVDYRDVRNRSAFGFTFVNPIDIYTPVYNAVPNVDPGTPFAFSNVRLHQTGLYAQDQVALGNLFFLVGGRNDWTSLRNGLSATTTDQDKFTYRLGVNYVLPNGLAPYIGYSTSFEPVLGTDSVTLQNFKPSEGKQIEGGIKYNAKNLGPDVELFATLAGFDINQTNVVTVGSSITPVFGTQSGEVEVYGAEVEVVGRFFQQLSVNAAYSYNHSEVTKDLTNPASVGAQLVTTPEHKFTLFVDYTLKRGALAGLGFGSGLRYFGRSPGSLPGPFNPLVYFGEDPVLFDADIHYDTPDWRLALNASNLADERYVARCASASGCTYGAGRQVIVTLTKKF